ncbi:FeS cluster assembly protein SufD [Methylacidimicrobium cyclopophantes]|uniref:FeS cluster assembly protein SufD n=1 Tax=Methylacidimicrobium cyclopophantes TaxID=1041766 RepID=A0A5E6M7A8_9BACT|nr:Fe-S cluster assembly protein SufD [Methylacidimicrobium cyclopophantes]VVM05420.1 FeS cluster assembly protein SufD [Methylacidimicrobium cyclopophantes]
MDLPKRVITEVARGESKPARLPAWWKELQDAAWADYERLPMPNRKDERWRFTDLNKIAVNGCTVGTPISGDAFASLQKLFLPGKAAAFLFANDSLLFSRPLSPEARERGVIFAPLLDAAVGSADLVKSYLFEERVALGAEKLESLHRACATAGAFLYVPRGIELKEPLELSFWLTEANAATFPHLLVILEENAHARLHLRFGSTNPKGGFACSVEELFLGAGAKLDLFTHRKWAEGVCSFDLASIRLSRDAASTTFQLNLGGSYTRTESRSRLLGPGAQSVMLSATLARDREEFDQRSFQEHAAPRTKSDLLYKSALYGSSRTIFAGMIDVDPQAQQTDAYQSNRNLILSPEAEANSLPGLEILANDVRCTHGSTIGQVDPEELFYCLQRGIPLETAQRLFVLGFLTDVVDRIEDEEAKSAMVEELECSLR